MIGSFTNTAFEMLNDQQVALQLRRDLHTASLICSAVPPPQPSLQILPLSYSCLPLPPTPDIFKPLRGWHDEFAIRVVSCSARRVAPSHRGWISIYLVGLFCSDAIWGAHISRGHQQHISALLCDMIHTLYLFSSALWCSQRQSFLPDHWLCGEARLSEKG